MFTLKNLLFPSIQFEIRSKKKPAEIASLLAEETTDDLWGDGRFRGKVSPDGFKLIQLPPRSTRNSATPVITGSISAEGEETAVSIKIRMVLFVQAFFTLWSLPLPFIFIIGILSSITDGLGEGFLFIIMPIIFFAVEQLIFYLGFWRPAKKTKEWFETWLA